MINSVWYAFSDTCRVASLESCEVWKVNPILIQPVNGFIQPKIKDNFIRIKFSNNSLATIKSKQLHIFGVNYNVFVITNGQGMLLYT